MVELFPNVMKHLCDALKDNFTIVNLGCIGDTDYRLPDHIAKILTVVEVDAMGGAQTKNPYYRKIPIRNVIGAVAGRQHFIRNAFAGTCSLLPPRPGIVEAYGMERYYDALETMEVQCETLPAVLRQNKLSGLDFLKTDVEGLDTAVIKSCENFLGKILCIQCELRFEPFYESEPFFHETVSFLAEHGYEVVDILHIDRWKYKTPRRNFQIEGRAVWADFLFFLKPGRLASNFGQDLPPAVAKQIILACMLGKKNYGEYLFQQFADKLPDDWKRDFKLLFKPRLPNLSECLRAWRRAFMPWELFLKHRIGRSQHVSIRLGN